MGPPGRGSYLTPNLGSKTGPLYTYFAVVTPRPKGLRRQKRRDRVLTQQSIQRFHEALGVLL